MILNKVSFAFYWERFKIRNYNIYIFNNFKESCCFFFPSSPIGPSSFAEKWSKRTKFFRIEANSHQNLYEIRHRQTYLNINKIKIKKKIYIYIYLTTLALIFLLPVVGRCRKKRGKEGREIYKLREGIRPQDFSGFLCEEDEIFPYSLPGY